MSERDELELALVALEGQRATLGDAVVDAALGPIREKLAALYDVDAFPTDPADDGERKIVTVIFADLSGSTALGEVMDPEEIRDMLNRCFDRLVPVVKHFGGTVTQFQGDNIVALFGAPVAHENDPERALRACLGMMDALEQFNRDTDVDLGIHIGVNTGLVIAGGVGSRGDQSYSVIGDAVNVAARLEGVAVRGEIIVGPDTHRLAEPFFEFEDREAIPVKGRDEPVKIYQLLSVKSGQHSTRGIHGLWSPLVGRDSEVEEFNGVLNALAQGHGGVVAVVADAGVGKSRFVAEARSAPLESVSWAEGAALAHTGDIPYALAADLIRDLLGVAPDSELEDVSGALAGALALGMPLEEAETEWPFMARLLDLPLGGEASAVIAQYDRSPEVLVQRTEEAFGRLVEASASSPLVLVWEDLHWADEASLKLLERLLRVTGTLPLLLVLMFRPGDSPVSGLHGRLVDDGSLVLIKLSPLSREDSESLVDGLMQIESLPAATRGLILDRAQGNPLFLEELLRALIDAGMVVIEAGRASATDAIHGLEAIDIPDTVHGVIGARIDRLPAKQKTTLQSASVIGRVFQRRVLERVASGIGDDLGELQRLGFIASEDTDTVESFEYLFRHVFTQEAAYNGILFSRRRRLHKAAAEAIEALFPNRLDELSGTLARHYEAADAPDQATRYLLRAAHRAADAYANEEAVAFVARGLALADVGDNQSRSEFLLIREGVYGAIGQRDLQREDLESLEAIHDLLADEELTLKVTLRRARYAFDSGAFEAAAEIATSAAAIALELDDESSAARAHVARGKAYALLDRPVEAEDDFQHALKIAQKLGMAQLELEALQALGVQNLHGETNNAEVAALQRRALIIAERLGDRRLQAYLNQNLANTALMRNDLDTSIQLATKSLQLGEESGIRGTTAGAYSVISEALLLLGRSEDSLEAAQRGLDVAAELDMKFWVASLKLTIAGSLSAMGRHEEAITSAEEAVHHSRDLAVKPYLMDGLACLTRVRMAAGDTTGAGAPTEEVLEYLLDGGSLESTDYPLRVYATCLRLLRETEDQRFDPLLSQAIHLLEELYPAGGPMPWHIEINQLSEIP